MSTAAPPIPALPIPVAAPTVRRPRGTTQGSPVPAMGPANRAPGVSVMGGPSQGPHLYVMGGPDTGPRVSVMGQGDRGIRLDLFGDSDPRFVDSLFTP